MSAIAVVRERLVLPRGVARRAAPAGVTLVAVVIILVVCGVIQPRIWSTSGLTLILSSIVPLVFAAMAQMVMMSIGDIDLSIGAFVGLVSGVAATLLRTNPLLAVIVLLACVVGYAIIGALVQLRSVPSLIATLGASFIWFGIGLFLLPTPGGTAPDFLLQYAAWAPPFIPAPVIVILGVTLVVWFVTQRTSTGAELRALGSNPVALARSGASTLRVRMTAYALVAVLGILSGLALTAEIGGGDVSAANDYTLVSVAAVILGGGTFFGGRAVAWGTLFGAVTLGLLSVLLSLLNLSSNIQPAIQGGIVIAALAGRLLVEKVVK